ncbi:probable LRR receptor-like serine/threonine-protein kinase At4g29180 [Musa acuminata AAA Group]|uniref:probable LRR receptor-like serine/threonine-protein kinase At4g29180 n=1 Tax=Musa acuminata AAA Group TaxID=214697 RepID=UPI0031D9CCB9
MRLSFGKETMVLVEVSVCTEDGLHGRRYVFALVLPLACTQSPNPRVDLHALFDVNGFISIDCGNANSKYLDPISKISYVSDDQFINAGSNFDISSEHINSTVPTRELNLRSFPDGLRNCYRLKNVSQNRASLVRATFMYGNYDGKNSPTKFDLHIGVDYWKTIIISDPSAIYTVEALSYATANLTSVCLINTGSGTPFISSLELRPLGNGLYGEYVNASQSVVLITRRNFGASDTVRYRKFIFYHLNFYF